MSHAKTWVLVLAGVMASRGAAAQPAAAPEAAGPANGASPEMPPSAPEGAPAQSAPATAPPAAAEPSPAQAVPGTSPAAAAAPAQESSSTIPSPSPSQAANQRASSVPEPPAEDPASLRAATATTAVDAGARAEDPTRVRFALELGAGFIGAGRFQSDAPGRSNQEAVDGMYGLGAMIGNRSALYGLAVEVAGLGRDHFSTANGSTTVNAAYHVDTLWVQGRWYFSQARPAVFLTAAAGPAVPVAKATGTRPSDNPVVAPPVAFQCTETGKVGLGLAAALGVEFDMARAWSFVSDARFAGHVLSRDSSEFAGCAPAVGSALSGTVRIGIQLRL